jgi:hypothetical protein
VRTGLIETNLAPRRLELAEADLDRVGGVVLGDAEHQEVAVRSQSGSPNSQNEPPKV